MDGSFPWPSEDQSLRKSKPDPTRNPNHPPVRMGSRRHSRLHFGLGLGGAGFGLLGSGALTVSTSASVRFLDWFAVGFAVRCGSDSNARASARGLGARKRKSVRSSITSIRRVLQLAGTRVRQ